MTEAYVFDALRTPRGKGKKDGTLHEVKPIDLLAGLLTELQARHRCARSGLLQEFGRARARLHRPDHPGRR